MSGFGIMNVPTMSTLPDPELESDVSDDDPGDVDSDELMEEHITDDESTDLALGVDPLHYGASPTTPNFGPPSEKYGRYGGLPSPSIMRGSTGFTPLVSQFPSSVGAHYGGESLDLLIEDFQRRAFVGWTSRELADLDIRTSRTFKKYQLNIPIIPLIDVDHWETTVPPVFPFERRKGLYRMKYKYPNSTGWWTMENPAIKQLMLPVLRLASAFISNRYLSPWFDGFYFGKREKIPQSRSSRPLKGAMFFMPRNTMGHARSSKYAAYSRMYRVFDDRSINYGWGFVLPETNPDNGEATSGFDGISFSNSHIEHEDPDEPFRVWSYLSIEPLEQLLRPDLTDNEKKSIEYHLAITMVHEIAHGLCEIEGYEKYGFGDRSEKRELFYMDQPLAEMGYAMELDVLGGITSLEGARYKAPRSLRLDVSWPHYHNIPEGVPGKAYKILDLDDPSKFRKTQIKYFTPSTILEEAHSDQFWSAGISKFGFNLLHANTPPIGFGRTVNFQFDRRGKAVDLEESRWQKIEGQLLFAPGAMQAETIITASELHREHAMIFEPSEREPFEFCRKLLDSAKSPQDFWDASKRQSEAVQAVNRVWKEIFQTSDVRLTQELQGPTVDRYFFNMLGPIADAVQAHEESYKALCAIEAYNLVPYSSRRTNLYRWNAGTRAFLNQIWFTERTNGGSRIRDWCNLIVRLEVVHMQLFSPLQKPDTDPKTYKFEEVELQWLLGLEREFRRSPTIPGSIQQRCIGWIGGFFPMTVPDDGDYRATYLNLLIASAINTACQHGFFEQPVAQRRITLASELADFEILYEATASQARLGWRPVLDFWIPVLQSFVDDRSPMAADVRAVIMA